MAAQKIDKSKWQAFFDRLSRGLVGMRAEIEVASLALGDQIEAEWLPLMGITYDSKNDVLEIALEGLDHLIKHPKEVWADAGAGADPRGGSAPRPAAGRLDDALVRGGPM